MGRAVMDGGRKTEMGRMSRTCSLSLHKRSLGSEQMAEGSGWANGVDAGRLRPRSPLSVKVFRFQHPRPRMPPPVSFSSGALSSGAPLADAPLAEVNSSAALPVVAYTSSGQSQKFLLTFRRLPRTFALGPAPAPRTALRIRVKLNIGGGIYHSRRISRPWYGCCTH